ncbi:hypothetical protein B0T25DRAFT_574545 [Lasiosphaeria hispida]|uniref:SET domain-containing protein n=1 Tax=Lasiosphaeria hispida TaxID=260671 RepID=A0AAJ0H4W8_9PEZI|nr:hypothetical protein B0T25DRAFT_574545 [Lasiosphaeria hispida]
MHLNLLPPLDPTPLLPLRHPFLRLHQLGHPPPRPVSSRHPRGHRRSPERNHIHPARRNPLRLILSRRRCGRRGPRARRAALRDLPGRGKGLVATRPVARRAVLMVDWAALLVDAEFPQRVRRALGREMLMEAIGGLERGGREVVLGLARSSSDPGGVLAAEDVVKMNSFSVDLGGRSFMALFPRISRMNHACKPSASTRFDMQTLSSTVTTFHQPGEETTISYADWGLTYPERQRVLKQKWGFDCACFLCSSSAEEIAESDARRKAISRLGKEVLVQVEERNYKKAIKLNREMLVALEDEALVPHMGDYYEVMTRLYGALPDIDNAKMFAKLALEDLGVS